MSALWFSEKTGYGVRLIVWWALGGITGCMLYLLSGCAVNLAREGQANVDMHEQYAGSNRVLNIKGK